jgi:hypothetical protein
MDSASGRFVVSTYSGSTYIVDLDEMWLLRRRASGMVDIEASELRRDDEKIPIVAVVDCTVLRPPIFLLAIVPGILTIRRATMVLSIHQVGSAAEDGRDR